MTSNSIHTFIDFNSLTVVQSDTQKYGPVSNTQFRVSGLFTLGADSMAYAVVGGKVLIQPQAGASGKVNLIIQPTDVLPAGLPRVKYFIYRGLRLDNFLSGSSLAASSFSDLLNRIYTDYSDANGTGATGQPKSYRLGYDLFSAAASYSLDKAFAEARVDGITNQIIELSRVEQGETLGKFVAGEMCFDIVLEDRFSVLTLDDVRQPQGLITAAAPSSGLYDELTIAERCVREKVLAYLDPAAFYSFFGMDPLSVVNRSGTTDKTYKGWEAPTSNAEPGVQNLLNVFKSKDWVYIDLRNEYGYSVNYGKDNQGVSGKPDFRNHFQYATNNNTPGSADYYAGFWPVFIAKTVAAGVQGYAEYKMNFWRAFNPVPVIYADFALQKNTKKVVTLLDGVQRFSVDPTYEPYDPDNTIVDEPWSNTFSYYVPTNSSTGQVAWLIKLYINRRYVPNSVTLPAATFRRDHYLDNVFGPVLPLEKYFIDFADAGTQWQSSLGKRYISINLRSIKGLLNKLNDTHIELMVDMGVTLSGSHIRFFTKVTDCQSESTTSVVDISGSQGQKVNAGKSSNSSAIKARNIELQSPTITNINPNTYDTTVLGSNTIVLYPVFSDSFLGSMFDVEFSALFSRQEYVNTILPAALTINSDYHEVGLNMDALTADTGTSTNNKPDLFVKHCSVKLSGYNSAGAYQVTNPTGPIQLYSYDGKSYVSNDAVSPALLSSLSLDPVDGTPNGLIELADFIAYVDDVEADADFMDVDANVSIQDPILVNWAKKTATRIRVHSYGGYAPNPWKANVIDVFAKYNKKVALEHAIVYAPYKDYGAIFLPDSFVDDRNLEPWDDDVHQLGGKENIVYKKLTGRADENGVRDNPSPYIRIPRPGNTSTIDNVDMGQILFGFESLVTLSFQSRSTFWGYSKYYKIYDPFDLASIIANIATPIANIFTESTVVPERSTPDPGIAKELLPTSSNVFDRLDRYYGISAPDADIMGNTDAVGLMMAYSKIDSTNPKLSDALKLYYQQPGTTIPLKPDPAYYTANNRWLILCQFLNLITINGNTINWLPGNPSSAWNTGTVNTGDPMHYLSFENKACLVEKMRNFTLFWMNITLHPYRTGLGIVVGADPGGYFIPGLDDVYAIYPNAQTEKTAFYPFADYILNNHFLPLLKSRLTDEQTGKQII